MNAYIVYDGACGPEEGACLVFAANRRDALKLGRPVVLDWFLDARWIDVRARRLTADYSRHQKQEGAHVVEDAESCESCLCWGPDPLDADGRCPTCVEGENVW